MTDWQMFSFTLKLTPTIMAKSLSQTKAHREMANPKSVRSAAQQLPQRDTNAARQRSASEGATAASKKPEGGGGRGPGACVFATGRSANNFYFL